MLLTRSSPRPQVLNMCPPVQDAVARLCCAWWAGNGPDKEELLSQTLPFLLVRRRNHTGREGTAGGESAGGQ